MVGQRQLKAVDHTAHINRERNHGLKANEP